MDDMPENFKVEREYHKGVMKVERADPVQYRLAIQSSIEGEIWFLQGLFKWQKGDLHGFEWRTIPAVYLNEDGEEIK